MCSCPLIEAECIVAATQIDVFTIVFPRPEYVNSQINYQRLPTNESFNHIDSLDITTLSLNSADPSDAIAGLVYVPDIGAGDCWNRSIPYVPTNVTRQKNLPPGGYKHIAVAPWLAPECVLEYLAAAQPDATRAFIFFLPNTTAHPPNEDAAFWDLGDNGDWKKDNHYPVYALPGSSGRTILEASSQYSGMIREVPFGQDLAKIYPPDDYVRLLATVQTKGGNQLPSLWIFLLVVLAIVLGIIGLTSLVMHMLQRRRRHSLRRRVASGEVDLEALGIKRLTVPQQILNKMPLYTYGTEQSPVSTQDLSTAPICTKSWAGSKRPSPKTGQTPSVVNKRPASYRPSPLQQPTCAICLDDFVPATSNSEGTIVRELPCHHIFHPECVDTFLRDSSSLCPMCKKTVLPQGYCPRVITNAMVRRERIVRRLRPPVDDNEQGYSDPDHPPVRGLGAKVRRHAVHAFGQLRHYSGFSTSETAQLHHSSHGLRGYPSSLPARPPAAATTMPRTPPRTVSSRVPSVLRDATPAENRTSITQPSTSPTRRDWASQRALAMLGQSHNETPLDPDAEEAATTPRWRKAVRSVFPWAS